jgi:hypothetical protein
MLETGRSSWRAGGIAIMAVVCGTAVLAGCGGGGDQSSTTPAQPTTAQRSASTASTTTGKSTAGKATDKSASGKPSARTGASSSSPHFEVSDAWRKGHKIGQKECAGVPQDEVLAHFLALAKAAQARHPDLARRGMIERVEQLPKDAYHGTAAPAMAAALVATGMPVEQRAGGFAGCVAALGGTGSQ